jgi:hypothetical protein
MTGKQEYLIALFRSVNHVIQAEKLLATLRIPHKIIPVPKSVSTECGVCIRILPEQRDALAGALEGHAGLVEIRNLPPRGA